MKNRLETLTLFAASDILVDEGMHEWPPVVSFDEFQGEVAAWMSSRYRVVALLQDFPTDFDVVGYVELPLVVHQSV